MAQVRFSAPPKPYEISQFLGVNEAVGETETKIGEAVVQENFRITVNMKAQKRPGHHTFIDFGSGNVQGIWEGVLDGKNIMLSCWNGDVYEYDMSITTTTTLIADLITEGTVTIVGSITDAKTNIRWFNSKVYFRNGTDYKEYDGTTYQDVVPYTPIVAIDAPPLGGGTLFEEVNLLNGEKTKTFVGDATTLYILPETGLDADLLTGSVDGVTKVETTDFTVNRTLGQVTWLVAPPNQSTVSLTWTKVTAGNADLVKNHKYAIDFGVGNDTNLFIFGNVNEKNVFRFSGINKAGYFPADSFVQVGSDEFAITALQPQYQQLIVFQQNSAKIVKPTENPLFTDNTGLNPYNFPYFDLNESVGNIAPNMVQLIENNPVTLDGFSMWSWASATSVEDERNARIISDRLKLSLQGLNLSTAVTFDHQNQKEYWVNVDNIVYIWNYGNNTMYKYTNINAVEFIEVEGDIYYAANGTVEHINEAFLSDGQNLGDSIPCVLKLGFTDFNTLDLQKTMRNEWLSIEPSSRTSVDVTFVTDKKNKEDSKVFNVSYSLFDYGNIDYGEWNYSTNRNPQPKRLRGKIKNFTYLQTIFENDTNNESLTVLKLLLQAITHRFSG